MNYAADAMHKVEFAEARWAGEKPRSAVALDEVRERDDPNGRRVRTTDDDAGAVMAEMHRRAAH